MAARAPRAQVEPMMQNGAIVKTTGALLAIGAVLIAAGLAVHPPETPDLAAQRAIVAQQAGAWTAAHAVLTLGTLLVASGALVALAATRLARGPAGTVGWALVALANLALTPVAGIEATSAVAAAAAGDAATFSALTAVALGLLVTMPFALLGLVFVAGQETRTGGVSPMLAWAGVVLGALGFLVAAGTLWLGNAAVAGVFNPVTILALLWLAGYGASVATRGEAAEAAMRTATA